MPKVVPEYKEDAKRRIIEAAMDVIAERGCDQMTIDDVAKKIGVTKGAVYWYFKSKEELVAAVLKKFQGDIERTSFESFYNRPIEEVFSQLFERFSLTDDRQRAIFFEMFALAARNSEVRHATREYYSGLVATFEEAIRKEKKQHLIGTQADPHTLALLMVALYAGLQNYEMIYMYQNEIEDLWLEGMKILLKPSSTRSHGDDKPGKDPGKT
jgi:AcrR family transcriptional regulator